MKFTVVSQVMLTIINDDMCTVVPFYKESTSMLQCSILCDPWYSSLEQVCTSEESIILINSSNSLLFYDIIHKNLLKNIV